LFPDQIVFNSDSTYFNVSSQTDVYFLATSLNTTAIFNSNCSVGLNFIVCKPWDRLLENQEFAIGGYLDHFWLDGFYYKMTVSTSEEYIEFDRVLKFRTTLSANGRKLWDVCGNQNVIVPFDPSFVGSLVRTDVSCR